MPVKTSEREYRDINLGKMELRTLDDGQMVVDGYATTWGEYLLWEEEGYRVYEKFDPHAFDKCDRSDIIMQLNHEGRVYARGGNKTLVVEPDENGLRITAYLGGTEEGRKIFEEIKGGYRTKMSHGFRKKSDKREVIEDHETGMISTQDHSGSGQRIRCFRRFAASQRSDEHIRTERRRGSHRRG